jgi:uncharacterized protein (TIGR02145 family)
VSSSLNPSGVQGVCPAGWHIPSDDEWKELEMELGMSQADANATGHRGSEGIQIKESGTTHWRNYTDASMIGNNESGFTSLPGGSRSGSSYSNLDNLARYWTSSTTHANNSYGYFRQLNYHLAGITRAAEAVYSGNSVRCVRD